MAQDTRGAFSRYATPSRRAVTQSPEVSMLRAICACTASTSSIREGGETMQPRYTAAASSRTVMVLQFRISYVGVQISLEGSERAFRQGLRSGGAQRLLPLVSSILPLDLR